MNSFDKNKPTVKIKESYKKTPRDKRKISQIKQQELNYSLYEEWQTLKANTLPQVPEEQLLLDLEEFTKRYQQMTERLDELKLL